jgi:transcriptional regulator with GAF, ATPase, and Fis domain
VILTRGAVLEAPLEELEVAEGETETPVKLKDVERAHIARILREADGVIGAAAARLGIPRSTLLYKMRRLGIGSLRAQKPEPPYIAHSAHG